MRRRDEKSVFDCNCVNSRTILLVRSFSCFKDRWIQVSKMTLRYKYLDEWDLSKIILNQIKIK